MVDFDCVVVGSGHAGSCAALSAVESGCQKVLVIDKCPEEWVGGNGYFTAGAHRTVHDGLGDVLPLVQNAPANAADRIEMTPYTREDFVSDIMRLGGGRPDPALVNAVVNNSRAAITWLSKTAKIPFILSFHRQAYEVDGKQKFWGGMVLSVEDGGKGLINAHQIALKQAGVQVWFNTAAISLVLENDAISGLVVRKDGQEEKINTRSVVLAAGGFEANSEMRAQYLGAGWEKAMVRGTPYNTGDGFKLAADVGAKVAGDWAGCHSTAWDANAPLDAGARDLTNQFTKSGYPLGIMINAKGARFVDEGEDYRNYTYAKFGRAILSQPGGYAFQIWDAKMLEHLRKEEYGDGIVEKIFADDVNSLAEKLVAKGLDDKKAAIDTILQYNEAVRLHRVENPGLTWDPAVKDTLSTQSDAMHLPLPKSNWALSIHKAPLMAVKVACGVTFTFGGLAINPDTAEVISQKTGAGIPGLFCTGEMVGGLFYNNYPGGSGLTAGAVFGIKAGRGAATASGRSNK